MKLSQAVYATCIAMFAAVTPAAAGIEPVTGDPVLFWHEQFLSATTGPPPVVGRHAAMLGVAIHDAVNGTLGRPNYGYTGSLEKNGGDTRAATSVAAHRILVTLYPSKQAQLDQALSDSLALIAAGPAKTNGVAYGAAIAAKVLDIRSSDGANAVVPYTPSGLPGRWAPTPPGNAPFAFTQLGSVTPWLLTSNSQLRPGAPPSLGSAEYAAAFNEVKDIGALASASRTADQTAAATFWATTPFSPWIRAAIDRAQISGNSVLENATLMAQLSVATHDAFIATWDAKLHYDFWRPLTAIRAADTDGNPDTLIDAAWNSWLINPPYAAYSSGLSAVSGAGARILSNTFGGSDAFCLTYSVERCWTGFEAAADESAMSRLWGGIHFRFDNDAGLAVGRNSAAWTQSARAFNAVPEPTTWVMMIAWFGLIGAVARQRRASMLPREA
ncbi:PEPxxWA-CTERM sorting domain-containing protein [Sandarakinorhabdus sp.]|uniref:PEPxxWA-CTERM sorting domain-containing protein n=1 Tax=Sandarakinorhabdus sp. TaxID=1916663 RepID=UPI00286DF87D|nr:PEPxxWA-CTERM sorting domain-containing protein [Sandarakinorhabdus sp.]